jgi:hypothetical protein
MINKSRIPARLDRAIQSISQDELDAAREKFMQSGGKVYDVAEDSSKTKKQTKAVADVMRRKV